MLRVFKKEDKTSNASISPNRPHVLLLIVIFTECCMNDGPSHMIQIIKLTVRELDRTLYLGIVVYALIVHNTCTVTIKN